MKRFHGIAFASGLLALGGCCTDRDWTMCFDWKESTTCPAPDAVKPLPGANPLTFRSAGTFWPAHEYRIDGAPLIAPAQCCYEVTDTVCTKELH